MKDIFISHSSKDKDGLVKILAEGLRENDLDVWMDSEQILAGEFLLKNIEEGISESHCCIFVITNNFLKSHWACVEAGMFMEKKGKLLIPIFNRISYRKKQNILNIIGNRIYLSIEDVSEISHHIDAINASVQKHKGRIGVKANMQSLTELSRSFHNFNSAVASTVSSRIRNWGNIANSIPTAQAPYALEISKLCLYEVAADGGLNIDFNNYNETTIDDISTACGELDDNTVKHAKLLYRICHYPFFDDSNIAIEMTEHSLLLFLNWYCNYLNKRMSKKEYSFEIVPFNKLTYEHFLEFYEIDKLVLDGELIASPNVTYNWYAHNPFSHIAIKESMTGRMAGYFAAFPIDDVLYQKILSGYFKDNDLNTENILQYTFPEVYRLYISSIAIHPDFRSPNSFSVLYNAIVKFYLELADRQIFISDMIAETSSKQGEDLCELVGLKKLYETNIKTKSYGNTKLYAGTLLPPSIRLSSLSGRKLLKLYKAKFEELENLFPLT